MKPRKKDRHLPACIYHQHGAYYYVKQRKWTRIGATLPEALDRYARIAGARETSVNALIDRFLLDARRRVKPNTLQQYQLAAKRIRAAFVEFQADQVQPHHIARFLDHHRHTPNMANRMRTVLQAIFTHAVRVGHCPTNPVTAIARFPEKKRDRYLTDQEYAAIRHAGNPALRAIMSLCYLTAQRIGDILTIRLDQIDPDGILFRQQKTGKRLLVEMSPDLQAAIDAAKALHRKTTPLYLLGTPRGAPRSYAGVRDLYRRAATAAGVQNTRLHDIRAKSITDARRQGLNAQQLAGHATESMTVRYLRGRETDRVKGPSIRQTSKVLDTTPRK